MTIDITNNAPDKTIITLKGELDTVAVQGLSDKLASAFNSADRTEDASSADAAGKQITFDFSQLEYISSAGMRVLLQFNKQANEKGDSVVITGMSENILQIFQLVGFDKIFTINP